MIHFAMAMINLPLMLAADASAIPSVGFGAMTMLIFFIIGSMGIGIIANRSTEKGGFMGRSASISFVKIPPILQTDVRL